jgi:ATP-binding cassette, subfamily F, member 3
MLTISQLSKSFAGRALFDDVSLQVNRGDRIGLVGPNGAGKSTLFALLLGEVSPDKGTIAIEKNATIGFLPQETAAAETKPCSSLPWPFRRSWCTRRK